MRLRLAVNHASNFLSDVNIKRRIAASLTNKRGNVLDKNASAVNLKNLGSRIV